MDDKLNELMKNGWSYHNCGSGSGDGGSSGPGIPIYTIETAANTNRIVIPVVDGAPDLLQPGVIFCVIPTVSSNANVTTYINYNNVSYVLRIREIDATQDIGSYSIAIAKRVIDANVPLYISFDASVSTFVILNRIEETGVQWNELADGIYTSDSDEDARNYPVRSRVVGDALKTMDKSKVNNPIVAQVGQVMEVSAVDEAGKPTAWKMVDYSGYHTHGTVMGESEIMPEQTVESSIMGTYIYLNSPLVPGNEYTVHWDGAAYTVTADANGNVGDSTMDFSTIPFWIYVNDGTQYIMECGDNRKDHTISIMGLSETIKHIDPKYMPDPIAMVEKTEGVYAHSHVDLWSSTAGSTKRFRVTVDDSGTLSAAEIT